MNEEPTEPQPRKRQRAAKRVAYAEKYADLCRRVTLARHLIEDAAASEPNVAKALLGVALKQLAEG